MEESTKTKTYVKGAMVAIKTMTRKIKEIGSVAMKRDAGGGIITGVRVNLIYQTPN